MSSVYNIKPFQYVHVLNKIDNKKRLIQGPANFAAQDHEVVINGEIKDMITLSDYEYILIKNPVQRQNNEVIVVNGIYKNKWGYSEVRTRETWGIPFPLYPGEEVITKEKKWFVPQESGLHVKAILPLKEGDKQYFPGDEWMIEGPCYVYNKPELEIVREVKSKIIVKPNALKIKALRNFTDSKGNKRVAGEQWLIYDEGAYLPHIFEEVVEEVKATILDEKTAIHLRALNSFVDIYNIERKAGEEWMISKEVAPYHTCGIYEEKTNVITRTVLTSNQYVIIENPYNEKERCNEMGKKRLIKGVTSFFLAPGESMSELKSVYVLTETNALLLQALENFKDEFGNERICGDKWMIKGPVRYIPPVEVNVLAERSLLVMDKNEGVYIRNKDTGEVRAQFANYLLQSNEVSWEKELPDKVEKIYLKDMNLQKRDKTKIISYRCPFNSIMQIYNLKQKTNRIVIGPNLVNLSPDEEFCLITLSGKTPKKEGMVETLYLKLGPTFSTDEFQVETSDHTRLILKLAYNWKFEVSEDNEQMKKIFSVRDFIGDLCSTMASRVRSYIATMKFEDFHKNSDSAIKKAVFGEVDGKVQTSTKFESCCLLINDVDIKSVTPSDPTTQVLLQKSVFLAIELTTKTIEQEFNIQAQIKDQEFKGELEKLRISNEIEKLKKKIDLNKLQVESDIIEKTGLSRAQALAQKEANLIESKSVLDYAKKEKEASEIQTDFEVKKQKKKYDIEYTKKNEEGRLKLLKEGEYNEIESSKFKKIIEALGADTLVEIAKAGPELKAKLLQGLNLSGYILTDGNNPINLFNVADNLVKKND